MCDESKTIINTEIQKQLSKQHEDLLKDTLKLLFIKKLLLERSFGRKKPPIEKEARSIKILRVQEFLCLDKNDDLLNLGAHCSNVSIPYTEQKSLHKKLELKMQTHLNSLAPIIQAIKTKFPDLLQQNHNAVSTPVSISADANEIFALDIQRRECYKQLADIHCEKLKLLKAAIDLKLADSVIDKTRVLHLEMSINQTKTNLLRDYMVNDFINSSENTFKAIKLIEQHIDKQIDEEESANFDKKV